MLQVLVLVLVLVPLRPLVRLSDLPVLGLCLTVPGLPLPVLDLARVSAMARAPMADLVAPALVR